MASKRIPELIIPKGAESYSGGPIGILGPPGIGKSTIGKKIAKKMKISFLDLDEFISKKTNMKNTKEVIRVYGRLYFWKIGHKCLKEVLLKKRKNYVLAFSGGVICHRDKRDLKDKNLKLIKKYSFNILLLPSRRLKESVSILWPRQEDNKRNTGINNIKELKQYLKERKNKYRLGADVIVFTNNSSIKNITSSILRLIKK